MRSSRQDFRLQRHQQEQLCRLILALPQRKLPQERIESEFDDRAISNTPKAHLNPNAGVLPRSLPQPQLQPQQQQQEDRRRERIKVKIKSQVRQKIKKLSREWSLRKPSELLLSGYAPPRSVQGRSSEVFSERFFEGEKLGSLLGKCVAEQIQLRQKEVLKNTKYRSRLISTSQRSHGNSGLNSHFSPIRVKMSTPQLEAGQGLEPWRYSDDLQEEACLRHN